MTLGAISFSIGFAYGDNISSILDWRMAPKGVVTLGYLFVVHGVFFTIFIILPPFPHKHWAAIGCTEIDHPLE